VRLAFAPTGAKRTILLVETKSKRLRYVYLDAEAVRLLKRLRSRLKKIGRAVDASLLLTNAAGGSLELNRRRDFARMVKAAGIRHCTIHDLRRTFCTDLAAAGVNQTICAKRAGHANPATTAKYYQAMTDEMARAAARRCRLAEPDSRAFHRRARVWRELPIAVSPCGA
jgi:integrase